MQILTLLAPTQAVQHGPGSGGKTRVTRYRATHFTRKNRGWARGGGPGHAQELTIGVCATLAAAAVSKVALAQQQVWRVGLF